ncbi:MAG: hypothetical protein KGV59_07925, partial [Tenacibaculum sp.]|nr:hypothetical protein [Tenacibaculum sp.]
MDKLLKALLSSLVEQGLISEELANVTEENQIEGIVNHIKSTQQTEPNFTELLASDKFKTYVTENGFAKVLELSKTLKSEHDKKVTQGIQTFKEKFEKPNGTNNDPKPNEMSEEVKDLLKTLTEKVTNLENEKNKVSKLEQAKALIGKSKLPKSFQNKWVNRINLDSEVSFEDQIKGLEEEYTELHKEITGNEVDRGLPGGTPSNEKVTDEEVTDVVDSLI